MEVRKLRRSKLLAVFIAVALLLSYSFVFAAPSDQGLEMGKGKGLDKFRGENQEESQLIAESEEEGFIDEGKEELEGQKSGEQEEFFTVQGLETQSTSDDDSGAPSGNGVQPVYHPDNKPPCSNQWSEHYDFPGDGKSDTYDLGSGTVTLTGSVVNGEEFVDWEADGVIVHVMFIKGGSGGNLYYYDGNTYDDTDLHSPIVSSGKYAEVSHIAICYENKTEPGDITITVIKEWFGEGVSEVKPDGWKVEAYIPGDTGRVLVTLSDDKYTGTFTIAPGTSFNIKETGIPDDGNWAVTGDVSDGLKPMVDTTYTVTNTYTPPSGPDDITITLEKVWEPEDVEKPTNWGIAAYIDMGDGYYERVACLGPYFDNELSVMEVAPCGDSFTIRPSATYYVVEYGIEGECWSVSGTAERGTDGFTAPQNNYTHTVTNTWDCDEPEDITITLEKVWEPIDVDRPENWGVAAYIIVDEQSQQVACLGPYFDNELSVMEVAPCGDSFKIQPGATYYVVEYGIDGEGWVVTGTKDTDTDGFEAPQQDYKHTVTNTYTPPTGPKTFTITLVKAWNMPSNMDKPSQWQVRAFVAGNGETTDVELAALSGDEDSTTFDVEEGTTITIEETGISSLTGWSASGSLGSFTPTGNTTYTVTNTYTPPSGGGGGGGGTPTSFTPNPSISVTKTASVATAEAGDVITYNYVVINTGNVSLSNVTLDDDQLGTINLGSTSLAVGAQTTGTATYVVQIADEGTTIINLAVASGEYQNTTVTDSDVASVTVPEIEVLVVEPEPTEVAPEEPETEVIVEPEVLEVEPELPKTGGNGLLLMMAGLGAVLAGGAMLRMTARREEE